MQNKRPLKMIFSRPNANNETMGVRMQSLAGDSKNMATVVCGYLINWTSLWWRPCILTRVVDIVYKIDFLYLRDRSSGILCGLGRVFNTFTHATEQFWYHATTVQIWKSNIYASRYLMSVFLNRHRRKAVSRSLNKAPAID